ncbi:hypothetical protein [Alteribacillus bidgolensis]|uniref:Uncharacterized protein n=1 Tax=Alteribacillus bidgolensis TaxID=930129 RepID=A0A1G8K7G3_9BACI|nr:hypothetical protein [Alteribacillus bidgolensis]SDI39395.1 hypothetical protein SAMN05216352_10798 [Alteribacillus bidgolensis]
MKKVMGVFIACFLMMAAMTFTIAWIAEEAKTHYSEEISPVNN